MFCCQVPLLRTPDIDYLENILLMIAENNEKAITPTIITIGIINIVPNVLSTQKSLIVKSKGTGH